eukprot:96745-Rhodomonas_salina.1
MFAKSGVVEDVRMMRDREGKLRGFCYVQFADNAGQHRPRSCRRARRASGGWKRGAGGARGAGAGRDEPGRAPPACGLE